MGDFAGLYLFLGLVHLDLCRRLVCHLNGTPANKRTAACASA